MRDTRDKAESEPAEDEQDRIGNPQQRRQRQQRGAGSEQREQNQSVMRRKTHNLRLLTK